MLGSSSRGLVLSAVVLLAIGLGLWLRVSRSTHATPHGSAAGSDGRWPIDKPAVMATVPGGTDDRTGATALVAALEPYRREDYATATTSLEGFTAAHPESGEGWFYLGASRLLSGDPARARQDFEKARVLGAGTRHPEFEWLVATAEARTAAIEPARARLEKLCAVPGPLQVRACAAKESLSQ